MQEVGLDYFRTLLTSQPIELFEDILSSIPILVNDLETLKITRVPSRKEIRDVIFAMGRNQFYPLFFLHWTVQMDFAVLSQQKRKGLYHIDETISAVFETHDHQSNKMYNLELSMI